MLGLATLSEEKMLILRDLEGEDLCFISLLNVGDTSKRVTSPNV